MANPLATHSTANLSAPAFSETALVLAAHGSTRLTAANAHVQGIADEIRARNLFAGVECAFLIGEGQELGDTLLRAPSIVVVPFMMADGYLVEKIGADITRALVDRGSRGTVMSSDPIGTHPDIAQIVERIGQRGAIKAGHSGEDCHLIVVAHGSPSRPESRTGGEAHVARLRSREQFKSVTLALLEEAPGIEEVLHARDGATVVVGQFAAPGGHALEDVGAAISASGRRDVIDAGPVGLDPGMVDLVLARAAAAIKSTP